MFDSQVNVETHAVTQVANMNPGAVFVEDEENKHCAPQRAHAKTHMRICALAVARTR